MNPRLLEIRYEMEYHLRQMLALHAEEWTLLQTSSDVPLLFDDKKRMIRWNGESIRLPSKQYLFVKTLWNNKKHEASFDEIDEQVWRAGNEKLPFSEKHTVFTLIRRAQKNIEKSAFPYKIEPMKNASTREIQGYKLVRARWS